MSQLFSRITPGRHRLPMNSKGIFLYIYIHIRVYLLYLGVISVCLGPTHVGDCWRAYTYWIQNASRCEAITVGSCRSTNKLCLSSCKGLCGLKYGDISAFFKIKYLCQVKYSLQPWQSNPILPCTSPNTNRARASRATEVWKGERAYKEKGKPIGYRNKAWPPGCHGLDCVISWNSFSLTFLSLAILVWCHFLLIRFVLDIWILTDLPVACCLSGRHFPMLAFSSDPVCACQLWILTILAVDSSGARDLTHSPDKLLSLLSSLPS